MGHSLSFTELNYINDTSKMTHQNDFEGQKDYFYSNDCAPASLANMFDCTEIAENCFLGQADTRFSRTPRLAASPEQRLTCDTQLSSSQEDSTKSSCYCKSTQGLTSISSCARQFPDQSTTLQRKLPLV